jgi:hypothetical protein
LSWSGDAPLLKYRMVEVVEGSRSTCQSASAPRDCRSLLFGAERKNAPAPHRFPALSGVKAHPGRSEAQSDRYRFAEVVGGISVERGFVRRELDELEGPRSDGMLIERSWSSASASRPFRMCEGRMPTARCARKGANGCGEVNRDGRLVDLADGEAAEELLQVASPRKFASWMAS